jgi:hypothetical protein
MLLRPPFQHATRNTTNGDRPPMKRRTLLAAAAAVTIGTAGLSLKLGGAPLADGLRAPAFATTRLETAEWEKLHAAAAPSGERWAEIPWETDLAAARKRAAKENRPLLMWIMDGHPLGCT